MSVVADVKYFFWLQFGDMVYSLALVSMFSAPDQDLLKLSHHATYVCHRGCPDVFTVIDIKAIKVVVAIVTPPILSWRCADVMLTDYRLFTLFVLPDCLLLVYQTDLGLCHYLDA